MHWQKRGPELRYDVIMQPSSQSWLFALDVAQTDQTDTRLMSDFHLQRRQPVEQRLFYRASSWPQALRESSIDPRMRWRNLQLPMHGNPRARALAEQLRQAHAQPQALVAALLQRFNREPFAYTLKPPATGADGWTISCSTRAAASARITPGRWLSSCAPRAFLREWWPATRAAS